MYANLCDGEGGGEVALKCCLCLFKLHYNVDKNIGPYVRDCITLWF